MCDADSKRLLEASGKALEDDNTCSASMTSVSEQLSQEDLLDESSELDTSSLVTTSDVEEGNTTVTMNPQVEDARSEVVSKGFEIKIEKDWDENMQGNGIHSERQPSGSCANSESHENNEVKFKKPLASSGQGVSHQRLMSTPLNWYQQPCFDPYWRHYHFVSMWCQKHMEVYRSTVEQYHKFQTEHAERMEQFRRQSHAHVFRKFVPHRTYRNRKARQRRKAAKRRMRIAMRNAELAGSCSLPSDSQETETGIEGEGETIHGENGGETVEVSSLELEEEMQMEVELEISEEMLDFFTHTHKHRQERDAMRKSNTTEENHVNIEDVRRDQKERSCAAPTERPGAKRTSEMSFLYGSGAPMIHGMETAMQMNFDRNLDLQQPSLWPNMPLRLIFN